MPNVVKYHVCYSPDSWRGWIVLLGPFAPPNTIRSYSGERAFRVARSLSRILNRCEDAHLVALAELVAGLTVNALRVSITTTPVK